jgi:hypothetical protein
MHPGRADGSLTVAPGSQTIHTSTVALKSAAFRGVERGELLDDRLTSPRGYSSALLKRTSDHLLVVKSRV